MPSIEILTHLKYTDGITTKNYGHLTVPEEFTITNGHIYEAWTTVEDDYDYETLWAKGDGDMDTFELLYLVSDADVYVELKTDMGTAEYALIEVKANIPLILTSDNIGANVTGARLDGALLVEDTDFAQVIEIVVQRDVVADAGDAKVQMVMFS